MPPVYVSGREDLKCISGPGLELASFEVARLAVADPLLGCSPRTSSLRMRKLDMRCAHRTDGAPRSARSRFRTSEMLGAGERIRTADRPLTRRPVVTCLLAGSSTESLPELGKLRRGQDISILAAVPLRTGRCRFVRVGTVLAGRPAIGLCWSCVGGIRPRLSLPHLTSGLCKTARPVRDAEDWARSVRRVSQPRSAQPQNVRGSPRFRHTTGRESAEANPPLIRRPKSDQRESCMTRS